MNLILRHALAFVLRENVVLKKMFAHFSIIAVGKILSNQEMRWLLSFINSPLWAGFSWLYLQVRAWFDVRMTSIKLLVFLTPLTVQETQRQPGPELLTSRPNSTDTGSRDGASSGAASERGTRPPHRTDREENILSQEDNVTWPKKSQNQLRGQPAGADTQPQDRDSEISSTTNRRRSNGATGS